MTGGSLIYLFAAYAVVWIALFGYMFFISQQIGDLRAELDSLRRRSQKASSGGSSEREA